MDREKAIASFVEHVEQLSYLPLVTDLEMKELYGEEVAKTLEELNRLGWEAELCLKCNSNCCLEHGCEFYAPQFKKCPIFDLRPAICRFHFCEKFPRTDKARIKELTDIFLYSLNAAAAGGSDRVSYFDPPPLAKISPELVILIPPLVNDVRAGEQ